MRFTWTLSGCLAPAQPLVVEADFQQPSVVSRSTWLATHRQPGICWLPMTFTLRPEARIALIPSIFMRSRRCTFVVG